MSPVILPGNRLCIALTNTLLALSICTVLTLFDTNTVHAHGTEISLTEVNAVEIQALFDDGLPMAEAQVSVYAPSDRATPWLTGMADEQGHFIFVPDRAIPGQWDIQLRTSGHGDWVYVDIAEGAIAELKSSGGGLTTAQIVMMSAAVIWGFVGTALYFMGGKKEEEITVDGAALTS